MQVMDSGWKGIEGWVATCLLAVGVGYEISSGKEVSLLIFHARRYVLGKILDGNTYLSTWYTTSEHQ